VLLAASVSVVAKSIAFTGGSTASGGIRAGTMEELQYSTRALRFLVRRRSPAARQ
jgi:hypothetical protein